MVIESSPSVYSINAVCMEVVPCTLRAVTWPVLGLYVNPVSVSAPCVPVAPSTNTGYTVSFAVLFADTVKLVAKSAVPVTSPVNGPAKASAVTVPSK